MFAYRYGIQYEPMAKEAFESLFNFKVLPAGLFVDEQYNFLAGSPDGLVGDKEIVEIKCPHNIKDMTPHQGVMAKKIKYLTLNINGDLQLNRNHHYYYQVQGQLRVANKLSCYFIVWTPKGNILYIYNQIIIVTYVWFFVFRNVCRKNRVRRQFLEG